MPPLACGLAPIRRSPSGASSASSGDQPALGVEQFLGPVAPHPVFEHLEVLGVLARLGERHLVGPIRPLDRQAVDHLGPGPALGRLEDDHRPARPRCDAVAPGVGLDPPDLAPRPRRASPP